MWRRRISDYDYNQYISSAEWKEKANRRLELDNHTCCVCGRPATEVHHLTYDHFKNERMDEIVGLCHECHEKAEELYDPALTERSIENGKNFMAAMVEDAQKIAPIVFDYLVMVRGSDFQSLMKLRQPPNNDGKDYWSVLKKAVNALCRKRYWQNCAEDRRDIMLRAITYHAEVIFVERIEHDVRNFLQGSFHDTAVGTTEACGNRKDAAEVLGISVSTLDKFRRDDGAGSSDGPTVREMVLYYCGLDAAAGIRPAAGFQCLLTDDYEALNKMADYASSQYKKQNSGGI